MKRNLISSGSTFEEKISYSRVVVDGNMVFVSGTTGYNYETMSIKEDIVEQTEQCFLNIEAALNKAGSGLKDIVRVMYILPDAKDFEKCWPVFRKYLGDVRPSATMISAGLAHEDMKIEIQVTALKGNTD
ncbi:RidA family protein [Flagellimonas lutimaris]|uniref:RidA family protein n=1 Tax=Flagellimonas lutimaris TaxID=475082 RepID=UPI003F5CCF93